MASVRKRKGSRFWYGCIRLPSGQQRHFSTGLEDRAEALAAATAAERAVRKESARPVRLRQSLARIADEFSPDEEIAPGDWLRRWAKAREIEVSKNTAVAYGRVMAEAAEWMAGDGITSFGLLTPERMGRLRAHLASLNAPSTVNKKMKFLRVAMEAAVREGRLDSNPVAGIGRIKAGEQVRRQFRAEEIARLLDHLRPDREWRALTVLGLFTGQRLNDLAELDWSQVNLAKGAESVTLTAAKTGRLIDLPLVAQAARSLARLAKKGARRGPVLPGIAGLARPTRSNQFRARLDAAGIDAGFVGGEGRRRRSALSFHSLRHTTTTMLKAAGVSDAVARAIIGHESVAISRSYTHLDIATMREALEKIAGGEG